MEQTLHSYCRHLRTKMTYVGNSSEQDAWRRGDKTAAAYWCLRTMRTTGPDDKPAVPEQCQSGRQCYDQIELI